MDPADPTTAQQIRIFLKNSALVELGQVTILQDGAGFHVQLVAGGSTAGAGSAIAGLLITPSSAVGEVRSSFFDECGHAFGLVVGGECGVE